MDAASRIFQWFPLVARPRPTCPPLAERVREVADLARKSERDGSVSLAAVTYNKAALIASDCGLPDLARSLCWRHHEAYLRTRPLDAQVARSALEPLVNLARLLVRSGDGEEAYRVLGALFQAVTVRSEIVIDGRSISFSRLGGSEGDCRALRQWMWAVLLADGARALISVGRWTDALDHLRRHKGVGARMLDGRQVAIVTAVTAGDTDEAMTQLADTVPGEPWENAVTACLTVLARRYADLPFDQDLGMTLDGYQQLHRVPELAVFHTRLGLTIIDAAGGVRHPAVRCVVADLVEGTTQGGDGYAARDVLAHTGCVSLMSTCQSDRLSTLVEACALGKGALPAEVRSGLLAALELSDAVIARTVKSGGTPNP
ncbi:hypothetical protein ACIQXD_15910 [Streptomyces uncialis]|uniref:hypothetical protein n=1 Tax=Streptomyces uncialis TaxID=1048205 RepID=UPI00381575CD